jgi:hypothetical protein
MKFLITSICSFIALSLVVACGDRTQRGGTSIPSPPPLATSGSTAFDTQAIVGAIPPNASREQVDQGVERFVAAFSNARSSDVPAFFNAFSRFRDQPNLVVAFGDYYGRLPKTDHGKRLVTLALLGELKRPDAMPFLHKIVWTPLPNRESLAEGLGARDWEEIVLIKAIDGLGYLRTPEADKALIEVMKQHESIAARNAAIDSYMWNHEDSEDAARVLYQVLPVEWHKFVQRPRFHRGMDAKRFNEQVEAWQRKWGSTQP